MFLLILTLTSAPAAAVELGLGVRAAIDGLDDPGLIDGPRLVVRQPLGPIPLSVAASAFLRLNQTLPRDDYASFILDSFAESDPNPEKLQIPVSTDRLSFSLGFDLPGRARESAAGWSGGPHLLGGLELRAFEVTYLGYDDGVVKTGSSGLQWGLCLPLGLGAEVDVGRRFALRGAILYRFALEELHDFRSEAEENDSAEMFLDRNVVTVLDVLVGL